MVGLAGAALALASAAPQSKIYGSDNIKRYLQRQGRTQRRGSFDPVFNRHTGSPHEHARAIARRLRQAEQVDANRQARSDRAGIGFSRSHLTFYCDGTAFRGRKVPL